MLDIHTIAETVRLIEKVDCCYSVLISEVAKEMGVKRTTLMAYIEQNPNLFTTEEKKDSKGNVKGLAIRHVYEEEVQNPSTDSWLEKQKKDWEKKLKVFELSYYGIREFLFIGVDGLEDRWRYHLWRNTPEKIQALEEAGLIKKEKTGYGGLGDYHNWEGYILTGKVKKALEEAGWELEMPEV